MANCGCCIVLQSTRPVSMSLVYKKDHFNRCASTFTDLFYIMVPSLYKTIGFIASLAILHLTNASPINEPQPTAISLPLIARQKRVYVPHDYDTSNSTKRFRVKSEPTGEGALYYDTTEYLIQVGVGTPPQNFYFMLDTGRFAFAIKLTGSLSLTHSNVYIIAMSCGFIATAVQQSNAALQDSITRLTLQLMNLPRHKSTIATWIALLS